MKQSKIIKGLKKCGAELLRQRNHQVWRLPTGENFVISASTSDIRAEKNNLSVLRKKLKGVKNES